MSPATAALLAQEPGELARTFDEIKDLQTLVVLLCVLVVVQVMVQGLVFLWMSNVKRQMDALHSQVARMLGFAEAHGNVNDQIKDQVKRALDDVSQKADITAQSARATAVTAAAAVEQIPERTAEKVAEKMKNGGGSGGGGRP